MSHIAVLTPILLDMIHEGREREQLHGYSVFGSDDEVMMDVRNVVENCPLDVFIYVSGMEGHIDKVFARATLTSVFVNPDPKIKESNTKFLTAFKEHFGNDFRKVKSGNVDEEFGWKFYYSIRDLRLVEPIPSDIFVSGN